MKQYKFPESEAEGFASECVGSKVIRKGNELHIKKGNQPFLRVVADIADGSLSMIVYITMEGGDIKFYEDYISAERMKQFSERNYSSMFFEGYPEKYSDLNAKQRKEVHQAELVSLVDYSADILSAVLASAFFSDTPTMEYNADGYPQLYNAEVLKAFGVDTELADKKVKGLIDCHGEPVEARPSKTVK